MSSNSVQPYWDVAVGLGHLTKDRAEALVRLFVQQGEAAAELAERGLEELLRGQYPGGVQPGARAETQQLTDTLGLARQEQVEVLTSRVAELERQVATLTAAQRVAEQQAMRDPEVRR